jgi:regulatory protein
MTPGPSLKARALKLLATREHSRLELERKLRPHETTEGELAAVLDALTAKGFVNENRVAEAVVHRKASGWGAARVRQALQDKGLPPDVVANALADLPGTEAERALQVWQRRFGTPPVDARERARQMRFLAARGFSGAVVGKTVPHAPWVAVSPMETDGPADQSGNS